MKRRAAQPPPPIEEGEAEYDLGFANRTEAYKHRREQFVREYIKDFNGSNAIRRMGSQSQTPWVRASEYLNEAYTQWFLAKMLQELDEQAIISRTEVILGLKREAHYHGIDGSAAARISAWRSLAKILGIEITKVEGNVNLGGGVMLMPFSGTPEQWEQASVAAQEKLKLEVRK